jgi:hypothetical protein
MHSLMFKPWAVLVLSTIASAAVSENSLPYRYHLEERSVLKPLHPTLFESQSELAARNYGEYDHLSPGGHAQMFFGKVGGEKLNPH